VHRDFRDIRLFQTFAHIGLMGAACLAFLTEKLLAQPATANSPEKQLRAAIESGKVEEAVALADKLGREKGMPIVQEYARTLKEPVARYAFYILQQRESNATIPFYIEILKTNPPRSYWDRCRFGLRRVNAHEYVKDQLECLRLPWTDEQKEKFVLTVADYKTAERRAIHNAVIDGKLEKQVLLDWKPPSDAENIILLKKIAAEEKSQRVQLTYYAVAAKWGDTDSLNRLHIEFQEAVNQMKDIKNLLDEKDKTAVAARQRFERAVTHLLYVKHPSTALWFHQLLGDSRLYAKLPPKDNQPVEDERVCDLAARRIQMVAGHLKEFPKLTDAAQLPKEEINRVSHWVRANQDILRKP
jgi:hypothetical protein